MIRRGFQCRSLILLLVSCAGVWVTPGWLWAAGIALPVQHQQVFSAGEQQEWSLTLKQGDYLTGEIQAEGAVSARITGPDAASGRALTLGELSREARIFFKAERSGDYVLQIRSFADNNPVSLTLKPVLLRDSGVSSGEAQILTKPESPAVSAALSALQDGQAPDQVWRMLTAQGTPLIEALPQPSRLGAMPLKRVTFLWRGASERVLLLGAPGYEHDPLYRLGDSDIWYRSYALPADTRLSYQLAPDVPLVAAGGRQQRIAILATAQQDPSNPNDWAPDGAPDRFAVKSVLELELAPSDLSLRGDQLLEQVIPFQLSSSRLGNTRAVDIWLPEQLKALPLNQPVPLAIFFDGKAYQSKVPTPRILQNLISAGKIPPLVAVFVDNPSNKSRVRELPCNPDFADFMAKELLPFVAGKTGRRFSAGQTLLAGSSFGGLASACTAFRYPEYFGKVLSLSGSYWWSPAEKDRPEWLSTQFAEAATKPIQFYLSAGRFETNYGESGILSANRHFAQILRLKGYSVAFDEFSAGHDYFHWRATLDRGLIHLLSGSD